jgi:sugar phosphate isomerase/epimerase
MQHYPFRLGTTSYIIPDDILPNVRYLADKVRDIELILFEVDDGPHNLPSPEVIDELLQIARRHELTYTVHLPLDLKVGDDGSEYDQSLVKAKRVIECTRKLDPWAYVLHLDGKSVRRQRIKMTARQDQSWCPGDCPNGQAARKLAVENWNVSADFIQSVLIDPVSRCVDIGHLWLDGHDPFLISGCLPHALFTCMDSRT